MADRVSPLSARQAAGLLHAAAVTLRAEIGALPEAVLQWHPEPGAWCAKEVLGHLIEAERRGFAGRIRIILAGDSPPLAAWDQDAVARERCDCARQAGALLEELTGLREDSARLVEGLSAADLDRGGEHPSVGHLRVSDLLHEWVFHDRDHIRQVMAGVRAAVWPHMANAQKFSPSHPGGRPPTA